MPHREIPVPVNAWVDEGIAELVVALNAVPGVMTLDSCQQRPDGLASVMFCTHDRAMLYDAVGNIARVIGHGQRENVTLSLWWGSNDAPAIADLTCPPALIAHLAQQLRANACRTRPSACGTFGTEPRS